MKYSKPEAYKDGHRMVDLSTVQPPVRVHPDRTEYPDGRVEWVGEQRKGPIVNQLIPQDSHVIVNDQGGCVPTLEQLESLSQTQLFDAVTILMSLAGSPLSSSNEVPASFAEDFNADCPSSELLEHWNIMASEYRSTVMDNMITYARTVHDRAQTNHE